MAKASRAQPDAGADRAPEVREVLRAAGFARVGFADAGDPPGTSRYREWLRRGYHGTMQWLARDPERRLDPRRVLPGTRTVIVAAADYGHGPALPDPGAPVPAGSGAISRYARGEDYHRSLERRLKRASRELAERFAGEAFRWYVDHGPVLEKAWAQRAGLGWIGKNTCSIDPQAGSYFFLACILSTLKLPPDEPATDHCGSCRLCLDACPTDAFAEPYVLDARRCISYLTIEERGPIDPDLEPGTGPWVFGCDVCQDVCPWNRGEPPPGDPELAPRPENEAPSLEELARLDPESFRARFPRSAIRRAKPRGFLRNVLVALGNSGRPELADLLDELAARDDVRTDPVLAGTLARARSRLRGGPGGPPAGKT